MSPLEEHIKRINEKLQQLVKRHTVLQKENNRMKLELEEIKKKYEEQSAAKSLLEQRIDVLKASKGDMNEEDKKAFEKRIQQYLKEIDKCINFMKE
jgi:predicted nuclease with TOPRIM domain